MTAPTVTGGATTDNSARSGTTFTMNLPSGSSSAGAGDTYIAFLSSEYGTAGAFSPGGSWVVLYDLQVFADGLDNPITMLCCYKKASGSEGSTENITVQDASTYSVCYIVEDAADPTTTAPEYYHETGGSDSSPYLGPIFPSAKKIDDYVQFRAHHITRNFSMGYPLPDTQYQVGGDCRVAACSDQVTGFSFDDAGFFSGFTTFWSYGSSRVVIYPATSYTHPADDMPHIQAVETTDESNLSGAQLSLQLPAGITSGDILLSVLTQDDIYASSSDGIIWPAGWTELYTRAQSVGGFVGSAAWKIASGSEGSSVNMTANAGGEVAAITYRIDDAHDTRVDFRFNEASSAFDFIRWKTLEAYSGSDNILWLACAHLPQSTKLNSADGNYSSFGRVNSDGGNASTRFSHRSLAAISEGAGNLSPEPEPEYLSVMFAVQSDTSVAGNLRTTQAAAAVLIEQGSIEARVTQLAAAVLVDQDKEARITQLAAVVLASRAPCILHRCQVWTITRIDNTVYRFTTHDQPVSFHGQTFQPCDSLHPSAADSAILNTAGAGDIEIGGLISDAQITELDLANGLFDGATVEVWQVPWDDPKLASDSPRRLLKGVLGKTTQTGTKYTAQLFTTAARLGQLPLLDSFTPSCRFELGDGRCPVDVGALTVSVSVDTAASRVAIFRQSFRQFVCNALGPASSSSSSWQSSSSSYATYWRHGLVTWTSGLNSGIQSEVKEVQVDANGDAVVTLWQAMPHEIAAGDGFDIRPGCNKSESDHTTKFGLAMSSFGGFPDVPGADAIIRGPDR